MSRKSNIEIMLEDCSKWRGVSYLAHRTIHELAWFCDNLIFSPEKILEISPELKKYPKFLEKIKKAGYYERHPFRPFITLFHEYCEIIYVKEDLEDRLAEIEKLRI